jgi:hypothetical protein
VSLQLLDATHRAVAAQMATSPQLQISPQNAAYLRDLNAALANLRTADAVSAAGAALAAAAANPPSVHSGPPPDPDRLVPAEQHLEELPMWQTYRRELESLAQQPEFEAALADPLARLLAHFEL